jgi:hypothetical protein
VRFLRLVRCLLFLLFGLGLTLAVTLPALAATYTWNGGDGNWKVAGNWSPPTGPPNGYDKAILPGGTVTLDTLYSVSELTLGAGATLDISKGALNLSTDNPAKTCLVTNNGVINLVATGPDTAGLGTGGNITTLTGGGEVVLGGSYNNMGNGGHGGSFINDTEHTIRGGGYLQAGITNRGQITADNGTLYLQAPFTNTGGAIRVDGAANEIILSGSITGGWLYPQDGQVIVRNSDLVNLNVGPGSLAVQTESCRFKGNMTLDPGTDLFIDPGLGVIFNNAADGTPPTFTHYRVINMNGQGTGFYFNAPGTLTGTGRIVMGGDLNNTINGFVSPAPALTHGPNHTIEGGGTLDGIINQGTIKANNGLLKVVGSFINTLTFEVADYASLDLTFGHTSYSDTFTTNDLFLPAHSAFSIMKKTLILTGNFAFAQQDPTKVTWGDWSTLRLSGGGPWQSVEVGGQDLGAVQAGFSNNFVLNQFGLEGTGTQVYLTDQIDNGHRSPGVREALYTKRFYVLPGATLNLNRIKLYTKVADEIFQVKAGDGYLYGGGQIIDVPASGANVAPISLLLLD